MFVMFFILISKQNKSLIGKTNLIIHSKLVSCLLGIVDKFDNTSVSWSKRISMKNSKKKNVLSRK